MLLNQKVKLGSVRSYFLLFIGLLEICAGKIKVDEERKTNVALLCCAICQAWFGSTCPHKWKVHSESIKLFGLIIFILWQNISILMRMVFSRPIDFASSTGHKNLQNGLSKKDVNHQISTTTYGIFWTVVLTTTMKRSEGKSYVRIMFHQSFLAFFVCC